MDEDEEVDVYCGTYCASFVSLYLSFVFRDTQWLKFKESEWYDASNTHTYNFIRLLIWAFVFKACISYPFSDVNRINNCMTKLMMRPYFFLLHPMHRFCCFCSPFCLPWLLIHFHECLLFFVHKSWSLRLWLLQLEYFVFIFRYNCLFSISICMVFASFICTTRMKKMKKNPARK